MTDVKLTTREHALLYTVARCICAGNRDQLTTVRKMRGDTEKCPNMLRFMTDGFFGQTFMLHDGLFEGIEFDIDYNITELLLVSFVNRYDELEGEE